MRRAAWMVVAIVLWPTLAVACPVCASGQSRGVSTLTAIAIMIAIPYAIGTVAFRAIRRADRLTRLPDDRAPEPRR